MAGKFNAKSSIIAGGVTAVAAGILIGGLVGQQANATDSNSTPSTSASGQPMPGMGHGPDGRHGMGMMGGHDGIDGTVLVSDRVFKAADGTLTTVRHQFGTVTAVSSTSITVKSDTVENTYVIDSNTVVDNGPNGTASIADIKVDDQVGIEATLSGDTATAVEIHAMPAIPAADANGNPPAQGPDNDGDGPRGPMGGMMGGRGHGGPGHGPDGDGDGPRGPMGGRGPGAGQFGTPVSETSTVKKADGTIVTVNEVHGTLKSVSGSSVTITDADGKDVTFTVPSTVTPERDRASATLADYVVGDHVRIAYEVSGSTNTVVAIDAHSAGSFDPAAADTNGTKA